MNGCIDSNILIEVLNQRREALGWISTVEKTRILVPGIVALELIYGARDNQDLIRTDAFLKSFEIIWPVEAEWQKCYALLCDHRLASGIDIHDALIAAICLERSLRLYTLNIKHFRPIKGLDVQRPYVRGS